MWTQNKIISYRFKGTTMSMLFSFSINKCNTYIVIPSNEKQNMRCIYSENTILHNKRLNNFQKKKNILLCQISTWTVNVCNFNMQYKIDQQNQRTFLLNTHITASRWSSVHIYLQWINYSLCTEHGIMKTPSLFQPSILLTSVLSNYILTHQKPFCKSLWVF